MQTYTRTYTVQAQQWLKKPEEPQEEGDDPRVYSYVIRSKILSEEPRLVLEPLEWAHVIPNKKSERGEDRVCPGDWVLTLPDGTLQVLSDETFRKNYEVK